jgi:hypothetical protein
VTVRRVGIEERRARLGRRHHLAVPARHVVTVAGDLVGLHSSDPATVFLSVQARVAGLEVSHLEAELYEHRSLLRLHGMRRTMFVVPRDLAAVIEAACTRGVAVGERKRLRDLLGGSVADPDIWYERALTGVTRSLELHGEAPASVLKQETPELGLVADFRGDPFPVLSRVLFQMSVEGHIVRSRPKGTWRSSQYHWTLAPGWADRTSLDVRSGEDELVRRWLASYGPATLGDVAWWTGWPKGRTAGVLARIGAVEVDAEDTPAYVLADDIDPVDEPAPWVALLPGLDSTTMGWKERHWYLGDHRSPLFDRNGNAGPTVWVDGRVVGGWAQRPDATVAVRLLETVGSEASGMIAEEADRLEAWLGGHVVIPRFRTPLEIELSS